MKALFFLFTCSILTGFAQSYSIHWYTIDGGGGSSAGGNYTIRGTFGQPDAGDHDGPGFALTGGFWGVTLVQTLEAPELFMRRNPTDKSLTVYWTALANSWVLEEATSVNSRPAPSLWFAVNTAYTQNGTQYGVSIPSPAGQKFYRLRRR